VLKLAVDPHQGDAISAARSLNAISMTQEADMSRIKRTLLAALAGAGAIALATESAHAWGRYTYGGPYAFAYRPYAANFTYRPPYAYRAYYGYRPYLRPAYAFAPLPYAAYGTYNYHPSFTGYYGSGTFSDGRRVPGTNYNPNQ
jgi:hypothetical protein